MMLNEGTAVSSAGALLVPYERRHVPAYHHWMQDTAIQEATASEPLTLDEEYANQESWRASYDRMTFIVTQPLLDLPPEQKHVEAGKVDSKDRMVGDINLFIYGSLYNGVDTANRYSGEVDIMIADEHNRRKGFGRAAVTALLYYIACHREAIVGEYLRGSGPVALPGRLAYLMAKIKKENIGSIALFRSLGFEQQGEADYFGEVQMALPEYKFDALAEEVPAGYAELEYRRPHQRQWFN